MKKVFKYATGQEIPKGAVYLTTLVEILEGISEAECWKQRFVWHYFLVDAKER